MTDADGRPRYGERSEGDPADGVRADGVRAEGRPAPQYGEYAPAGWVSPVAPVEAPRQANGAQDPEASGAVRTELHSPPKSTSYDAPPPTGAPVPGRPPAALRNAAFNRFATFVLLAYGLYDVIRGAIQTSAFVTTYVGEFRSLGYLEGTFRSTGTLRTVAEVSAVGSVAVFLLVAIWAIRRLRSGRRSWVLLLVAGILVNLLTGIAVVSVVMNDPSFVGIGSAPL